MARNFTKVLTTTVLMMVLQNHYAQTSSIKVLFIGNSITSFNNLPYIFKQFALEKGHFVIANAITFDGMRLKDYLLDIRVNDSLVVSTIDTIAAGNFNFVIIQDALTAPVKPFERVLFYDSVIKFDSICKKYGCKLIVFKPYPIPIFPIMYCDKSKSTAEIICTNEFFNPIQLLDTISLTYRLLEKSEVIVAPIGDAFVICSEKKPKINLYADDEDFHPSLFGSYLIACIYYRICFSDTLESKFFLSLDYNEAIFAQQIANELLIAN